MRQALLGNHLHHHLLQVVAEVAVEVVAGFADLGIDWVVLTVVVNIAEAEVAPVGMQGVVMAAKGFSFVEASQVIRIPHQQVVVSPLQR